MSIGPVGGGDGTHRPSSLGEREERVRANSTGSADGDRVEVSGAAKQLSELADRASRLPDVRQERVEALSKADRSGGQRVEASDLARSILEFEDGLFD